MNIHDHILAELGFQYIEQKKHETSFDENGDPKPLATNHLSEFKEIISKLPPGAIAEFGSFEGGSTIQLAKFGRMVYAFDTFEGFPEQTYECVKKGFIYNQEFDFNNPPGKFIPTIPVFEYFNKYSNIIPMKGVFQDTLPKLDSSVKFAFVYLDCDWYTSYRYVVQELARSGRITLETVALVDDYYLEFDNCMGCKKAIDEMVSEGLIEFDKNKNILKWKNPNLWKNLNPTVTPTKTVSPNNELPINQKVFDISKLDKMPKVLKI